jgi:hypothetical protein
MMNSIFKKSNWTVLLPAVILFFLLAASPLFADYSGHVASFKSEDNAVAFVNKLKAKGLVAFYQKEDVPGKGKLYRTYIGGYKTDPLAREALTKLKKSGEIDYFKIQKMADKKEELVTKKIATAAQKNEPARKPENKTAPSVQKPEDKVASAIQKPEDKAAPFIQKPENKVEPSIGTQNYYKGIKGIVLKNGKVVKGQIISIDDNDVLKIRTKQGKILSYSFMKEVKEYIKDEEYEPEE